MKRLNDLKAEQENLEHKLRKLLNPATLKAQAEKWTEHEAKKAKMMEEYKHQISFRADTLPITKISYVVNSRKEATMKITRGNNPLNLIEKRLGLPPPVELATFGLTAEEKKRKRTELIKEIFVTKNVRVDEMDRNLIPPSGIMPIQGPVINKHELVIFFMNGNTDIGFQRESIEDQLSAKHQLAVKGLSECKASESNIRRIQVKDIVKEVDDYLKTYSSAGMDISQYVEGIR
nr:hypothetical protein [Tanacetum cinerariifolium]